MIPTLLALTLSWQGLFVGIEKTTVWRDLFTVPGVSASATTLVGVGKISFRVVYIQPLQRNGYGPALQVGGSVRVF